MVETKECIYCENGTFVKINGSLFCNNCGTGLDDNGCRSSQVQLSKISLSSLRKLSKEELTTIILLRESKVIKQIEEFGEKLKTKDRDVFKTLREENEKLHNILLDESVLYKELESLKKYVKEIEGINNSLSVMKKSTLQKARSRGLKAKNIIQRVIIGTTREGEKFCIDEENYKKMEDYVKNYTNEVK